MLYQMRPSLLSRKQYFTAITLALRSIALLVKSL